MRLSVSEILEKVQEFKTMDERVNWLRRFENLQCLKTVLKYTFDTRLVWALPEGAPPYRPCEVIGTETRLYNEHRILYLFIEGGNPNLSPLKREMKYIELLESIHPNDAKLLNFIKDNRKIPYPKVSKRLINKAFPGLIDG